MYKVTVPDDVKFILNTLNKSGYGAHIVGGCVRDMLIGKAPTDYDITTSAMPDEVKAVFSDYRMLDTGLKHGTVTLLYQGAPYEITTYRTEGAYTDNRHPDSVSFTRNLELDLSRRDFTVNAICADAEGRLTDMFSGVADIESRTIRAVGNAAERFSEDALRILRAIRFSATLGFELDCDTSAAVHSHRFLLSGISGERIYSEIMKLLGGAGAYRVLSEYADVIVGVLSELRELKLPERERFEAAGGRERLVSLFALRGGEAASDFDKSMAVLHTDSKIRELGRTALSNLYADTTTDSALLRLLFKLGEEGARFTASVKELALGECCCDALEAAICSGVPYKFSAMNASGGDFAASGFVGKEIGAAMERTLFAIIDGKLENENEVIKEYIKRLKRNL